MRDNQKKEMVDEMEWETMGSFITDLAKNNESVTDDILREKSNFKNTGSKRAELSEKTVKLKTNMGKSSSKRNISSSQQPSGGYDTLHSDIRSLLDELQEIKQARIDLQSKLNTIRQ